MLRSRLLVDILNGKKTVELARSLQILHGETKLSRYPEKQLSSTNILLSASQNNLQIGRRWRYDKQSKKKGIDYDSEEEEEDDSEELPVTKGSQVVTVSVTSLRVDLLLKMGLNVPRNKIEAAFYDSKIRLNGEKIFKKSVQSKVGHEIDFIRGVSPQNPNFLIVSRVEVLKVSAGEDCLRVKLRRDKSLLIENYKDPWKKTEETT